MIHSVEKKAKNVDLAIEEALKELQVSAADAVIEVLDEGEPGGLLGFGRRLAHVRVSYEDDVHEPLTESAAEALHFAQAEHQKEPEAAPQKTEKKAQKPVEDKAEEHPEQASTPWTEEEKEAAENDVLDFLAHILSDLDIHGTMASYFDETDCLHIDVEGDDLGHAIGRGGETLNALQYLCNLAANKNRERYLRVVLDIGKYREKNLRNLRQRAQKSAERVLKSGKPYRMPPMSAAERRVVHLALAEISGIKTSSEGDEPRRRVVIAKA